jgi:hypothetical protein
MKINATDTTPYFELNEKKGTIEISGISKVVDAMVFFKPILDAVGVYIKEERKATIMKVDLEFFNTVTSKILLDLFRKLESLKRIYNISFEIEWYYEEDDDGMREAGEDYQSILMIPFKFISKEIKETDTDNKKKKK